MSIGPNLQPENPQLSRFNRLKYQLKKTTEEYFRDPVHYLSYGFLMFTMLGLYFGMKFSWQYYLILTLLFGIELYQLFIKKKTKDEPIK